MKKLHKDLAEQCHRRAHKQSKVLTIYEVCQTVFDRIHLKIGFKSRTLVKACQWAGWVHSVTMVTQFLHFSSFHIKNKSVRIYVVKTCWIRHFHSIKDFFLLSFFFVCQIQAQLNKALDDMSASLCTLKEGMSYTKQLPSKGLSQSQVLDKIREYETLSKSWNSLLCHT